MTRVIAVTSGKGGIGKSNFVLNVAISLAAMESNVLILDADLGLANLDVLLGVRSHKTLEDVVLGRAKLNDIIIKTDYRIGLIPGASGTQDIADLGKEEIGNLLEAVKEISQDTDFLLIDTSSGISTGVVHGPTPHVSTGCPQSSLHSADAHQCCHALWHIPPWR